MMNNIVSESLGGNSNSQSLDYQFVGFAFSRFAEMQKKGIFTDIVFISRDGGRFPVHRMVIAASCEFFSSVESDTSNSGSYTLHLDSQTTEQFLSFFYSGKINLTVSNVENILSVAKNWKMKVLIKSCYEVIAENLQIICNSEKFFQMDCVSVYELFEQLSLHQNGNFDNLLKFIGPNGSSIATKFGGTMVERKCQIFIAGYIFGKYNGSNENEVPPVEMVKEVETIGAAVALNPPTHVQYALFNFTDISNYELIEQNENGWTKKFDVKATSSPQPFGFYTFLSTKNDVRVFCSRVEGPSSIYILNLENWEMREVDQPDFTYGRVCQLETDIYWINTRDSSSNSCKFRQFDLELNEILTGEINLEGLTYHSRSTQIVIGLNRELFFFHSVENLNEVFSYDVRTHKLTNRGVLYNTDPRCRYNGRFGDIIVAGGTIYAANIHKKEKLVKEEEEVDDLIIKKYNVETNKWLEIRRCENQFKMSPVHLKTAGKFLFVFHDKKKVKKYNCGAELWEDLPDIGFMDWRAFCLIENSVNSLNQ